MLRKRRKQSIIKVAARFYAADRLIDRSTTCFNSNLQQYLSYTMIMATVVIFGEKIWPLLSFEIMFLFCVTLIQTTLVPAGQWTSR